MAKIGLNILATGFTGKLLIRWLEASAPLAEVGRSAAFDFPYDDVYTINDLNPVVHIVQLWQSDDGVALTQLIKQWEIDATLYNEISSVTYQYVVDRGWDNTTPVSTGSEVWADPVNIDTELVDERLDGATKDELYVVEAGYGPKTNAEYNLRSGGGIVLLNGKTFDTDVAWFITYNRIITQQANNTGVTTQEIADVVVLTANSNFYTDANDNHYNKLMIANGSGTTLTETFPAFSGIPNGTRAAYNTHRGTQNYLILQFGVGDTIYLNGSLRNVIYLAKGEEIKLRWQGGVGYVESYTGNDKIRGQIIGDTQVRTGAFLLCNESTGVLNGSDYPGIYEWLQSLPPGVTVSHAAWALEKSRWALDTIAGTFRVPHLADLHRRFRSTTEAPGTFQDGAMPEHDHFVFSAPGAGTPTYPLRQFSTGGNLGYTIEGTINVPSIYKTGKAGTAGLTENRVKNFKEIPLVIL